MCTFGIEIRKQKNLRLCAQKRKSSHMMRQKIFCIAADFRTVVYEPPSGQNSLFKGCAFNGIH